MPLEKPNPSQTKTFSFPFKFLENWTKKTLIKEDDIEQYSKNLRRVMSVTKDGLFVIRWFHYKEVSSPVTFDVSRWTFGEDSFEQKPTR